MCSFQASLSIVSLVIFHIRLFLISIAFSRVIRSGIPLGFPTYTTYDLAVGKTAVLFTEGAAEKERQSPPDFQPQYILQL